MTTIANATQQGYIESLYNYYLWTLSFAENVQIPGYFIDTDPRAEGWFLVDSPLPTFTCIALYLITVWVGPKLMESRTPYKLTWALVPYNVAMAALNFYIVIQLFTASTRLKYNYLCEPTRHSNSHPDELQIVNAVWWFYFSKVLEFCDTFFFILRKKDEQLSFLHVYHHSTMVFFWWIGTKWVPSGSTFLPAMINSGIHVLMYSYYGLSALGPQVVKYLWWKKYLTILQLIQFTLFLLMGINGLIIDCRFPRWMGYALVGYMISFIILFGNFYYKAYAEKGNKVFFGRDIMDREQAVLIEENKKNSNNDQNYIDSKKID